MTEQRTFLVTGASKGIGRAVSERLAAAGHRVIGVARSADDSHFPGTLISVDLADREQMKDALHDISKRYGIDGLSTMSDSCGRKPLAMSTSTRSTRSFA